MIRQRAPRAALHAGNGADVRRPEPAIRAHLAHYQISIEQAGSRYGADGEGPSIYIRDPEANLIELKGPSATPKRAIR